MFMTDGSGAGTGAQGAGGTGAQGAGTGDANAQTGSGNAGATGSTTADTVSKSEFDALSKKLDGVLTDNANYRKRLRQVVTGEDDDGDGKGSKTDKQAEILDRVLQGARRDRFTSQVTTAAVKLGAPFPEQVVSILNISDVADEEGNVKDVDKVVTDLKTKYPNLFQVTQGFGDVNGGAGGGSSRKKTAADVNQQIRDFRNSGRVKP